MILLFLRDCSFNRKEKLKTLRFIYESEFISINVISTMLSFDN